MQLIWDILKVLRVPEDRRLASSVDHLVKLHIEVSGTEVPGFLYRGLPFRHTDAPAGRLAYKALHPTLYNEVEKHLASIKNLEDDLQAVGQALLAVVRPCETLQDLRDALPDCLSWAMASELHDLPRTREEAWTLTEGTRQHRQYVKMKPRIEAFCAARLLY